MKVVRDYAEVSTVHGITYVFSRTLPQVDRLLWTILTAIGYVGVSVSNLIERRPIFKKPLEVVCLWVCRIV